MENLIHRTVEDLFKRIGFSFENLSFEKHKSPEGQEIFIVKLKSDDDCSLLLDDKGRNLKALEYIVRLIALKGLDQKKGPGQKVGLVLDLNNFLEKRNGQILELARLVAERVQTTQKFFVLRPMSAYERRLVHLELAGWTDVKTESIGEEPKRRVVIKPVDI
ncbi:MAG: R3H domain-containing nucleic acid-binding protein [Patescibacteria group bacterium]